MGSYYIIVKFMGLFTYIESLYPRLAANILEFVPVIHVQLANNILIQLRSIRVFV